MKTLDEYTILHVHRLYFITLIGLKNWKELDKFTSNWKSYKKSDKVCLIAILRINYLTKYMRESRDNFRYNYAADIFKEALDLYNTMVDDVLYKRYSPDTIGISVPDYNLGTQSTSFFQEDAAALIQCFLSFVSDAHTALEKADFHDILLALRYFIKNNRKIPFETATNCKRELLALKLDGNPFIEFSSEIAESDALLASSMDTVNISDINELGLVEVEIRSFPKKDPNRFYFEVLNGCGLIKGFAHRRFFMSSIQSDWNKLKVGDSVALKYEDSDFDENIKFATSIHLINRDV